MKAVRPIYRSFDLWKPVDDGQVIRFRCFHNIEKNTYCIQSADHYRKTMTPAQIQDLENQFLELLLEEDPEIRGGAFSSIEEAISHFENNFGIK